MTHNRVLNFAFFPPVAKIELANNCSLKVYIILIMLEPTYIHVFMYIHVVTYVYTYMCLIEVIMSLTIILGLVF